MDLVARSREGWIVWDYLSILCRSVEIFRSVRIAVVVAIIGIFDDGVPSASIILRVPTSLLVTKVLTDPRSEKTCKVGQ